MVETDHGPFIDLGREEEQRLQNLYVGLRERLLDLTKRNRMLNYILGVRSKRHLQFVDGVPEEIYRLLAVDGASVEALPLPEPEDIPNDEKTEDFVSALEHAKVADLEYLTQLQVLESTGRDDDHNITKIDRELRERLRSQLGMSPRPKRMNISRAEHARSCGIEPNPELPKAIGGKSRKGKKLQTLKFPDELDAVLKKISDDAHLAEQEMGLSTLFLAFGFLEWYESESSEKPHFAPLLLLPMKMEGRKVQGKKVFRLSTTAEAAESNLTLQKYLERDFGRLLPAFGLDEEEEESSIESYFDQIQEAIEGLSRWRIRRWLVLGHFSFGRLAMFEDLAPERWKDHPAKYKLVSSILRGTEAGESSGLPSVPDDYPIDDPEIEKIAPYLIHDADASQHSALVDVMRGTDLVIQGPPGTGKSQAITNIIANAFARKQSVLFLSEKQAALEVVKRRLDRAGLGEFCLEVHSEKSSSKLIIENVRRRIELGFSKTRSANAKAADLTWLDSRKAISDYLTALHTRDHDDATPFQLMWCSIRGRTALPELMDAFKTIELPKVFMDDPNVIVPALGQLEIYADAAQTFADLHGSFDNSPWSRLRIGALPNYEVPALLDTLDDLKSTATSILQLCSGYPDLLSTDVQDVRRTCASGALLEAAPTGSLVEHVAALNPEDLRAALELVDAVRLVDAELATKPDLSLIPVQVVARSSAITKLLETAISLDRTPALYFAEIENRIANLEKTIAVIEALGPAINMLGDVSSLPIEAMEALALAIIIMSRLLPKHYRWLAEPPDINLGALQAARVRWAELIESEDNWRTRARRPSLPWPAASDIAAAATTLQKRGIGMLFSKIGRSERIARGLVERLGFGPDNAASAEEIAALARHVQSVEAFTSDREIIVLMGSAWKGLATPFDDVLMAAKVRVFLTDKIGAMAYGQELRRQVIAFEVSRLRSFAACEKAATAFRMLDKTVRLSLKNGTVREVLASLKRELTTCRDICSLDEDGALTAVQLPINQINAIAELRIRKEQLEKGLATNPLGLAARTLGANSAHISATRQAIDWVDRVRELELSPALRAKLLGPGADEVSARLRQVYPTLTGLLAAYDEYQRILQERFKIANLPTANLEEMVSLFNELLANKAQLTDLLSLGSQRALLSQLGLEPFLTCAASLSTEPRDLPSMLKVLAAHRRANHARRMYVPLGQVAGSVLEARRRAFADRDKKKIDGDRAIIRALLLPSQPPAGVNFGPKRNWTEMALLKHELEKEQSRIRVRSLFSRAHRSLKTIMPCFMMSPLSLAKFLPSGTAEFDILIVDEASQMKPEDAIGGRRSWRSQAVASHGFF